MFYSNETRILPYLKESKEISLQTSNNSESEINRKNILDYDANRGGKVSLTDRHVCDFYFFSPYFNSLK